jgi:hypothetical protein
VSELGEEKERESAQHTIKAGFRELESLGVHPPHFGVFDAALFDLGSGPLNHGRCQIYSDDPALDTHPFRCGEETRAPAGCNVQDLCAEGYLREFDQPTSHLDEQQVSSTEIG